MRKQASVPRAKNRIDRAAVRFAISKLRRAEIYHRVFVVRTFALVLAPGYATGWVLLSLLPGGLSLMLWLLAKADRQPVLVFRNPERT